MSTLFRDSWVSDTGEQMQVALAVGDDQLRPTLPSDTPEAVANVALACYDPEPENRPSFARIVHHLRQVWRMMSSSLQPVV